MRFYKPYFYGEVKNMVMAVVNPRSLRLVPAERPMSSMLSQASPKQHIALALFDEGHRVGAWRDDRATRIIVLKYLERQPKEILWQALGARGEHPVFQNWVRKHGGANLHFC